MTYLFAIAAACFFMMFMGERELRKIHEQSSTYWYNSSRKWMNDFFKLYKKKLQQPKKK